MANPNETPPHRDGGDRAGGAATPRAGLVEQLREIHRQMTLIGDALLRLRGGAQRREAVAADTAETVARLRALRAHTPPRVAPTGRAGVPRGDGPRGDAEIISLSDALAARRRARTAAPTRPPPRPPGPPTAA